ETPRGAHDAAAGVRLRAAHVEVLDRRAVLRPARDRTEEEELLERQLALEDVPFGEAELAVEIEGREHLTADDDLLQVRSVPCDRVDDRVAERLALLLPGLGPLLQLERGVLHEAGQDVLARRGAAGAGQRWDHHVDIRL